MSLEEMKRSHSLKKSRESLSRCRQGGGHRDCKGSVIRNPERDPGTDRGRGVRCR